MSIFSPKKPKLAIAFDVGSSSVGAAGFLLSKGEKPRLVYSSRLEMPFQENFRFESFVATMTAALDAEAKKISESNFPPHSEMTVSCFAASPWYASQTRTSKKTFDVATVMTEKLLNDLYATEAETFKDDEQKSFNADAEIFEIENVQTKLNGYETGDPFGKTARDVQVSLYVAAAPQKILKTLKDKIEKHFPHSLLKIYTFPFSSFVVARDLFHEKDFLFLDISGEVTDISAVRDNVIQETASFAAGKNYLLRELARKTNCSPSEAFSSFRMLKDDMLHDTALTKASEALLEIGKEWRSVLQRALMEMTPKEGFLPHDVFVAADADVSPWFIENIQDEKLSQLTLSDDVFTVRHLNSVFMASFCDSEEKIERDPFLMIEGIFLARS